MKIRYPESIRAFAPVYALATVYLVAGALLRIVLWWQFGSTADVSPFSLIWILPTGAVNDAIEACYLLLPLALYLWLVPVKWQRTRTAKVFLSAGSIVTLAALLFIAASEYFFFEEFNARFNLVAFDYLMYPTEVIGDIRSEYPVGAVVAAALLFGTALSWMLRSYLVGRGADASQLSRRQRVWPLAAQLAAVGLSLIFVTTETLGLSDNRIANELAANGASSFFRAARTSEIDYGTFYATRDSHENFSRLTSFLAREGGTLSEPRQERLTRHFGSDPRGLGKLNVVVVVEESFGAEFSKLYGSSKDLMPNFDAYAKRGMWFRNMYASGTRTVRGLEAIAASFPPIPSVSILRRPHNEHIATWGGVMRHAGYQTSFLYGGYGYFDNMNYFFGNNDFEVLDRTDIEAGNDHVRFENIWGVSDEDLFDHALSYYDERARTGQPFFSMIMTTSNHKPFTFREGVPGVPASGGGRSAGVRYADFALGYFLQQAEQHDWFDHTVFVVVADHGARVYGKAEIPLRSYEIPMMVFAPSHVRPQEIDTLTGQIDIAPTVLGLLGLEYDAPFFGTDVLACARTDCAKERIALFSHNHDVALYRDGKLAVLGLGKHISTVQYDRTSDRYSNAPPDRDLSGLAVAIYQTAFEQFRAHRYE